MCRRIFITILVFSFLSPITKLYAYYYTTAHKMLKIESKILGVNPNYVLLDEIINDAMKEIKPLISNGTIPDKDVSKMFYIISGVLIKYQFDSTKENVALLSSALTPTGCKKDNCYYGDCDTLSFIYYSIVVDALKQEGVTNQKAVLISIQNILGTTESHFFVRWILDNGGSVNWETTAGIFVTDKDYSDHLVSKYSYYLKFATQDDVLSLAYQNVGLADAYAQNYQRAIDSYTEAIRLNPSILTYIYRAKAYIGLPAQRPNYQQALMDYSVAIDKIIKLDAVYVHPEYYYERGMTNYYLGNYKKAVDDLTAVIDPTIKLNKFVNSDYYFTRGNSYYNLQKFQLAVDDYNMAIELNPSKPEYYSNRNIAIGVLESLKNLKK